MAAGAIFEAAVVVATAGVAMAGVADVVGVAVAAAKVGVCVACEDDLPRPNTCVSSDRRENRCKLGRVGSSLRFCARGWCWCGVWPCGVWE